MLERWNTQEARYWTYKLSERNGKKKNRKLSNQASSNLPVALEDREGLGHPVKTLLRIKWNYESLVGLTHGNCCSTKKDDLKSWRKPGRGITICEGAQSSYPSRKVITMPHLTSVILRFSPWGRHHSFDVPSSSHTQASFLCYLNSPSLWAKYRPNDNMLLCQGYWVIKAAKWHRFSLADKTGSYPSPEVLLDPGLQVLPAVAIETQTLLTKPENLYTGIKKIRKERPWHILLGQIKKQHAFWFSEAVFFFTFAHLSFVSGRWMFFWNFELLKKAVLDMLQMPIQTRLGMTSIQLNDLY